MKAIVHIGMPKTGTTTIQEFLNQNQGKLLTQDIYVPPHEMDVHIPLFSHFLLFYSFVGQHPHELSLHLRSDLNDILKKGWLKDNNFSLYQQQFGEEIKRKQCQTVFISSEYFVHSTEKMIPALKAWLDPLFDEISILIYLRRQPEWFISCYQQVMKYLQPCYSLDFEQLFLCDNVLSNDYYECLKKWDIFGKDNICVRIFDRKEMFQNDLLADFASVTGIDLDGQVIPERVNVSMSEAATEFLRVMRNKFPNTDNTQELLLTRIVNQLLQNYSQSGNKGYAMSRSIAQRIIDQYRESNNAVAREYLGREQLFSDDVSMYPETSLEPLTMEQSLEISSKILEGMHNEYEKLLTNYLEYRERHTLKGRIIGLPKKIKKFLTTGRC